MNSSDLFCFAAAGAQTEGSMAQYQNYMNAFSNVPTGVSDWLKNKSQALAENFTGFMNSRLWEYSARLAGEGAGDYVGRFEIGYLGTIDGLQSSEGVMRDYIMANPNVMRHYLDGNIEGYDGEFSELCSGMGRENFFFRNANNGLVRQEHIRGDDRWLHTHFHDTMGNGLSFRERVNIQRTWNASNKHLAETYLDITSPLGHRRKDAPEEE